LPPVTPPSVRAELVEAWACWLIGRHAFAQCGGRVVAPAGDSLSFASPKESKQRKGDPKSATPSRCEGANLRRCGCGVRCGTHCAPGALRSDSRSESDNEAWALRRPCHPATAPPQAQPQGWVAKQPNSQTAKQPSSQAAIRVVAVLDPVSVAPSARRLRLRSGAMQRDGPCGCWLPRPSVCAEERRGWGGACAAGHTRFVN
jgi:hypothetical protein